MGFSDRWLNQNSEPKKPFAISAIPTTETPIASIANEFHESENEDRMRGYPYLAPCPLRGGHWVYRGQACEICKKKTSCPSWNVTTFLPETDLPDNIKKSRKATK